MIIIIVLLNSLINRVDSGFSETMSNDEFMDYLKGEGLSARDCSKLTGM